MSFFLNLFSPETYETFSHSDRTISGFRRRHTNAAARIKTGDKFVCYMTKVSRWVGILEVVKGPYIDETPIYYPENDPFVVRFRVRPIVWLPVEKAIPIHEDEVWNQLSFTRGQIRGTSTWTGSIRTSLVQLNEKDGQLLEALLSQQSRGGKTYPIDAEEFERLATHKVRRADKDVVVTVPKDRDDLIEEQPAAPTEVRESIKIQANLAEIGSAMGMQIWLPKADRGAVLGELKDGFPRPLDRLPLNYDETTLRTVEQIDVLWLNGRSIRRAFEVEHTTSVYSGILRMADLLALQPNMDIKLHIVAPAARREKVLQELRRPVFSLLERGPLSESCTYLSYDSVREIGKQPHLSHMNETVLDEYEEEAEE
jgi:predicted RNA-binding protein